MSESVPSTPSGIEEAKPHFPVIEGEFKSGLVGGRRLYDSTYEVSARDLLYGETEDDVDVRRMLLEIAEEKYGLRMAETVVEVGCSDATNLIDLRVNRGYSGKLIGVDINPNLFLKGEDTIDQLGLDDIELVVGKSEDLSMFPDGSIKVHTAWRSRYEADDITKATQEIWRILSLGGLAIETSFDEDNIPIHRRLERLVRMVTGGAFEEPDIRSRHYTPKKAKEQMLGQGFVLLDEIGIRSKVKIYPEKKDIYRNSFNTRRTEFGGPPSFEDWEKIMAAFIDPYIESELDANGYILDYVEPWGAIWLKPQVEVEPVAEA